jgi:acyl-coenzyme A thioesterase PaaI-like protein
MVEEAAQSPPEMGNGLPQAKTQESDAELRARRQSGCFVCGPENPRGLRLVFRSSETGEMSATWNPGSDFEGFQGIVHGGLVSTVMDEAMSKAVAESGSEALTAELRVRFRQPVASGQAYLVRGWIVDRRKRVIEAEASVSAVDGAEHAHGWARFFSLKRPA